MEQDELTRRSLREQPTCLGIVDSEVFVDFLAKIARMASRWYCR